IDGFQPEGVTSLAQDSVFMMPHLGVLSTVHPKAAMEIFEKDCLVRIGVCIAPRGVGKEGEVMKVVVRMPDDSCLEEQVSFGSVKKIPLKEGEKAEVEILPYRGGDVGRGSGKARTVVVEGGVVGIILDARGRPLVLPDEDNERKQKLIEWFKALEAYPERLYEMCGR
ncbi:MAG: methylaspartate mutase, partial [Candidatus Bathyarchaeota archaeon]